MLKVESTANLDWPSPAFSKEGFVTFSCLSQNLRNIMCFFGLFLCSRLLPLVSWPASRIRFQAFFVLIPTGHPPHDVALPALQMSPDGTLQPWVPLAIPTLPDHHFHLLGGPFQYFKFNLPVVTLTYSKSKVPTLIVRFFQPKVIFNSL